MYFISIAIIQLTKTGTKLATKIATERLVNETLKSFATYFIVFNKKR